jgi:hypothetical protein
MFSSTLAASNVVGRADTFIIITAANPITQGSTFRKSDPRIPSAIYLAGFGQYTFTGIIPSETDHTIVSNDLLYTRPTAIGVEPEGDFLDPNGSVGMDLFDPHDPVAITPFTIGPFSLTPIAIPEPSSLMLLGIGILSLAAMARRRFRRL